MSFIDHNKNYEKDKGAIFGKVKKDESDDDNLLESVIEEDEEEDDFTWVQQAPRRTLLDRVVGNIFGDKKEQLYDLYPKLAVITVPKMPIITPKGDEIIHKNKFKTQLLLLNHAWEQKKQLYETENAKVELMKSQRQHVIQEEPEKEEKISVLSDMI